MIPIRSSVLTMAAVWFLVPAEGNDRWRREPEPEFRRPQPPDPRRGPPPRGIANRGNQAQITLSVDPSIVYVHDTVTLRWDVRDNREGIAWSGPVTLRASWAGIHGLPDPAPASGSFSFRAGVAPERITFTLTTGGAITSQSRSVECNIRRLPSISSLTAGANLGEFRREISGQPGDRLGVLGMGFGEREADDRVVFTINGREFPLEIQEWTDTRIGATLPMDPPVAGWSMSGHGTIQVLKSSPGHATVRSNTIGLEMTARTRRPAEATLSFGAPRIIRPQSSGSERRDLSDHFALAVDVTYRPRPRVNAERNGIDRAAPITFKILTYNIAQTPRLIYAGARDPVDNIDDIARFLNESDYDVVCIQEAFVDDRRDRLIERVSGNFRHTALGPQGSALEDDGGLLILSRFPMTHRSRKFGQASGLLDGKIDYYAAKGVLHVRLRVGLEEADTIDLFTSHTDSGSAEIRASQFRVIRDFIDERARGRDWILAGDLNVNGDVQIPSNPPADEYSQMMSILGSPTDLWTRSFMLAGNHGYTFDLRVNTFGERTRDHSRLDYILHGRPRSQPAPPAVGGRL